MADATGTSKLVQDLADNPALASRLRSGADAVFDEYGVSEADRAILTGGDPAAIQQLVREAAGQVDGAAAVVIILVFEVFN